MPFSAQLSDQMVSRYGGRRALLRHWRHMLHYRLGGFSAYRAIQWERVERVCFVCTGNICRSPFAESVALNLGLDSRSCGLNLTEGSPANETAQRIALDFGSNLSAHRSRRFVAAEVGGGDLIVAMEPVQAEEILTALPPSATAQITLLGLWAENPRPYLHDPYGQADPYFQECFRIIDESVRRLDSLITAGQVHPQDSAASM